MKTRNTIFALLLLCGTFAGCKKDEEAAPETAVPTITNLEVGLNNNEIGVIGKDFHFNADILAATKIENVQIKILQRSGEVYAKTWSMEITWDTYKDAKNTNVHKHFDIPADAPEGKYDFLILVNDQNGSTLEIKKSLTLYAAENVPVNPVASIFNVFINDERFYRAGKFINEGASLKGGEKFTSQVTISNVKGNGKMYLLLINKKLNHRPESVDKIDFSKVIVYDVFEHKDWANSDFFSNSTFDLTTNTVIRNFPPLMIGATTDNNTPQAQTINGAKAWESGTYYYGVVYQNTTFNIGYFQYIEIPVVIN
jgi:hypothetical protein